MNTENDVRISPVAKCRMQVSLDCAFLLLVPQAAALPPCPCSS